MTKSDRKILGILFLFVFLLEFWVSNNSYTHDLYIRIDSAIFYMCGKAWMNGMVPYVDFSDAKGPLLWIIYGIGYLISNHTYIGVFWLECIFYTVTFFYCYKIARLFLPSQNTALIGSMLMALAFLNGAYHYEASAEDFCQPFITAGLYYTLRVLYKIQSDKDIRIASFVVGMGFATTLMIKFTLAAMILIFFFALFYDVLKNRKQLIGRFFVYAFAGIAIVLIPFGIYFLLQGNFADFINDYFIATTQTVVQTPSLGAMITDYIVTGWGSILQLHPLRMIMVCLLLINIALGCAYFFKKLPDKRWIPALMALWFICITMYHALGYYYQAFAAFAIFPVIMYLDLLKRLKPNGLWIALTACAVLVMVIGGNLVIKRPNFLLNESRERADFYYVNRILSQVSDPKIMYSFYDTGYGTPAHALPGCKYWTGWLGSTPVMEAERKQAITQQLPDFVIVMTDFGGAEDYIRLLDQAGYIQYHSWITQEGTKGYHSIIFGKPGFSLLPKDMQINAKDLWLKRQVISLKSEN
ncbi:MAG: glycosyltransferase family 39 protein [Tannerella sp.]|jgi:hypothetical protein|nr:glycosyltransferase family 39 protein [Tannerella sp.]